MNRKKLAQSFIVMMLFFVGLESSLRLQVPLSLDQDGELFPPDPDLLWKQPKGIRESNGVSVQINSLGMRGPEVPADTEREVRILSTGDSSVFGFQVEEDANYTAVACSTENWRPLILATPGYSTVQTLVWLRNVGESLSPDWVVIANLWSDQSVVGFQDRDLVRSYQQYRTRWRWKAEFLIRKSRLIQKIREGLTGDPKQAARDIAWQNNWATSSEGEPRVPLKEYAENLSSLVVLSESIGAKVAFVALAKKSELNGEIDSRTQAYREIMIQTAEIAQAPLIDAKTHWSGSGVSVDELFLDFLHPSPKGHQIIGVALYEAISASNSNEH